MMKQHEERKLQRRVRKSYLISTISIAMVLFLLGATAYLILNALNASNRLKENIALNVMLNSTTQTAKDSLLNTLKATQGVREVTFVNKEQAAKEFQAYIGENFEEFLASNPLPDSFRVTLDAKHSNPQTVDSLAAAWQQKSGVMEVVYPKNVLQQISDNIGKFNIVLLMLGAAMLVIALVLLNNTIRMTIISRNVLINTMRLVGATRGFIMRPFIASAVSHGIYAGLLSSLLLVAMVAGIKEGVPEITLYGGNFTVLWVCAGMIGAGILISLIFTVIAVNKSIRLQGGKVYLY